MPQPQSLIDLALAEDIGSGDITSTLLIPAAATATMRLVAKEPLVVAGVDVAGQVFHTVDKQLTVERLADEGAHVPAGAALLTVSGNAHALLSAERTALNLLQRACGVATLTRAYVDAVAGTKAVILDTRKTMPGLRALDKHAVVCGGGQNHRMGLYDAVMIKDNHVALGIRDWDLNIGELVMLAKKKLSFLMPNPASPIPIIVECDTLEQVRDVLIARPNRILLDNMTPQQLREAVIQVAGAVPLEASGGITLTNVRAVAETGVNFISIGALTHSAKAADISAEMELHRK